MEWWGRGIQYSSTPILRRSVETLASFALNLDRDVHARREVELLQLVNGLGGRLDDVDEPLVGALFESFLRLLVGVRGALDGKTFNTSRQRDGSGDTGAGALDGVRDIAGGLVDDPMVKGLQSNSNALSSHRKNNCLLMVFNSRPPGNASGRGI